MYHEATEQYLQTFRKTLIEMHGDESEGYLKEVKGFLTMEAARSGYLPKDIVQSAVALCRTVLLPEPTN
jgi:hypothetical protein